MNSERVEIGECDVGSSGELPLKAGAELLCGGRVVVRRDLILYGRCLGVDGTVAGAGAEVDCIQRGCGRCAGWVVEYDLLLNVGAVDGQQTTGVEAVKEEAISAADNGLCLLIFAVAVESIRERSARSPVIVIGDMVLSFPAEAAGESQLGIDLPVVLEEQRGVEHVCEGRLLSRGVAGRDGAEPVLNQRVECWWSF